MSLKKQKSPIKEIIKGLAAYIIIAAVGIIGFMLLHLVFTNISITTFLSVVIPILLVILFYLINEIQYEGLKIITYFLFAVTIICTFCEVSNHNKFITYLDNYFVKGHIVKSVETGSIDENSDDDFKEIVYDFQPNDDSSHTVLSIINYAFLIVVIGSPLSSYFIIKRTLNLKRNRLYKAEQL